MLRALTVSRTLLRQALHGAPATHLPLAHQHAFATEASNPVRFCIVGCGPAGFYTAEKDRLPTPFGLVRSGVAPDHQHTKNVQNQFTAVGKDPRVRFFGGVELGKDVSLDQLRGLYSSVVLAYGAESDRKLGVPGEAGTKNVFSAREFVWWYNGHPNATSLPIDLSNVESVVVCGVGNVALDCARVLLQPIDRLAATDVASHAVEALKSANGGAGIKHVHLLGRRSLAQAACTPKELKELTTEFDLSVCAAPDQLAVSEGEQKEIKKVRMKRRVVDIISQAAAKSISEDVEGRKLHFQFNRNPVEVVTDSSTKAVVGVRVEKSMTQVDSSGKAVAVGTGEFETIPAQLVLVSIGYKSIPVEGLPSFDANRGVVPNVGGRVLLNSPKEGPRPESPAFAPGLYVVGWLKRGPSGIIGTNLIDAEETVDCLIADYESQQESLGGGEAVPRGAVSSVSGREGLMSILREESVAWVSFQQWQSLDAHELEAGRKAGKVREKVVELGAMQQICHGSR
eukprot:gene23901-9468_t